MTDRTIELLETYLDGDYRISPMAPNKSTRQDVLNAEAQLDIRFPEEYVAHLLGENDEILGNRGIYIEVKEDLWRRPQLYDVGPFWTFLYGLHSYTASAESADWMRLDFAGKTFQDETGLHAVPILKIVGDADMYCLDSTGLIGRYNHELNEIEATKGSFWDVFEKELKELAKRKVKMLELNATRKKPK